MSRGLSRRLGPAVAVVAAAMGAAGGFLVGRRRSRSAPRAATQAPTKPLELHARLTEAWRQAAIDEMASVLAHELNQPLSALANYLRAARTLAARLELQDDTLIEALSRAGDQAIRAGEVVRSMRDLAARGGTHLEPESLSALIREVRPILDSMAEDAGAELTWDLGTMPDQVMADRIQVQQLMVNLVRRAIETTQQYGEPELKISLLEHGSGDLLTFVEHRSRRAGAPASPPELLNAAAFGGESAGLGLFICNAIVHNHRGSMWVDSTPDGGARYNFTLPRVGGHGGRSGRADGLRR